jgi:hypothetical protein
MPHKLGHKSPIQRIGSYFDDLSAQVKESKEELKATKVKTVHAESLLKGWLGDSVTKEEVNSILLEAEKKNNPEGRLAELTRMTEQLKAEQSKSIFDRQEERFQFEMELVAAQTQKLNRPSEELQLVNALANSEDQFTTAWSNWDQNKSPQNYEIMRRARQSLEQYNSLTKSPRSMKQIIRTALRVDVDKDTLDRIEAPDTATDRMWKQLETISGGLPLEAAWKKFRGGGGSGLSPQPSEITPSQVKAREVDIERMEKRKLKMDEIANNSL